MGREGGEVGEKQSVLPSKVLMLSTLIGDGVNV